MRRQLRRPPWLLRMAALAASAAGLMTSACGGGGGSQNAAAGAGCGPGGSSTRYGCAFGDLGTTTLEPDVVTVTGGSNVIRSATADGQTWRIDPNAPGVSQLSVGKVLLLSGDAVGRVVSLGDDGDSKVVSLAPVDLTSVVRNADIHIDQGLGLDQITYQQIPNQPGQLSTPDQGGDLGGPATSTSSGTSTSSDSSASPSDTSTSSTTSSDSAGSPSDSGSSTDASTAATSIRIGQPAVLMSQPYQPLPGPPVPTPPDVSVGKWSVKPVASLSKLGLNVSYEQDSGLKFGGEIAFLLDNPHVTTDTVIRDGKTVNTTMLIEGINELDISLQAGAANGSADNQKVRIEIPVECSFPIPPGPETGGLPLKVTVTYKFSVETAITGKNSTLVATGKYGLSGPIGMKNLTPVAPSFSVKQSLLDSVTGLTLGPSGVVIAVRTEIRLGLGIPGAKSGPYGAVITSVGVTNGSSLGAPRARCRSATLEMRLAGGVALSLSKVTRSAWNVLLPKDYQLDENGLEVSTQILQRSQTIPDVPVCTG